MLRVDGNAREVTAEPQFEALELVAHWFSIVKRRKWLVAAVAGGVTGLAALYCAFATPQYTATGQLLIDSQQARSLDALGSNLAIMDNGMVDSQVEILKSERIAKSVIKELNLVDEFKKNAEENAKNSWVPDFLKTLLPFLFQTAPLSDYEVERKAIDSMANRLTIKRVGASYVISIGYKSPSAQKAAKIGNQVAESYIVDQLESKYQATRRASVWLQDRISELREQALAADRAVQDYKAKHNIVDTQHGLVSDQQMQELSSQIVQSRAQVAEARARFERVDSIIKQGSALGTSDEAVSDVLANEVINRLRAQYVDAVKREAEWSKRYGNEHIAVVNLRSEIAGLKRALFNELSRIAETYKSDYEIAQARQDSLQKSMDELVAASKMNNQALVQLRELESTAQSYRALYDNFLQRFMQATQQQSFPITEARLITEASPPLSPSEPRTGIILTGGLALGLMLGFGIALWRENVNRTLRSSIDVEQQLGLECLGVLPALVGDSTAKGVSAFDSSTGLMRQVIVDPFSRYAETLRAVKVTVDISVLGQSKVIGITSTLPKEGKSTIAANLAQLIARSGARVVLIDADLRNPSLTRRLAPKATSGLLELILKQTTPEQVVVVDPVTQLRFIPAVVSGHIVHSNDIVASRGMSDLVEQCKAEADYVILDMPPVAPVVDVSASTHLVDGFVYILEWGRTHSGLVSSILRNNPKLSEKILGCLLNKADLKALKSLENYGSQYYYYKYQSQYGVDN